MRSTIDLGMGLYFAMGQYIYIIQIGRFPYKLGYPRVGLGSLIQVFRSEHTRLSELANATTNSISEKFKGREKEFYLLTTNYISFTFQKTNVAFEVIVGRWTNNL
jgi:hypothetical protein